MRHLAPRLLLAQLCAGRHALVRRRRRRRLRRLCCRLVTSCVAVPALHLRLQFEEGSQLV